MTSRIHSRQTPRSSPSRWISNRTVRAATRGILVTVLLAAVIGPGAQTRSRPEDPPRPNPLPPVAAPMPAEVATAPPPTERRESISIEDRIFSQLEQHRKRMTHPELRLLAKTIVEEARTHAMDPGLILAVIQVESGCRHRAVSPVGARGLMQVMPSTGAAIAKKLSLEWKGEDSLFDPRFNIKLGVAYLAELEQRYGDIRKALVAYNWGPTRVDRMLRLGKTLPRTYVEVVLSTYESGRNLDVRRS